MRRIVGMNVLLMVFVLLTAGCTLREKPVVSWSHLIEQMCSPESISDITLPCTEIYTSYDRAGGNNDYNNGFVKTGDGWLLLADLKGPGCLTRLWFTGSMVPPDSDSYSTTRPSPGSRRLRFV